MHLFELAMELGVRSADMADAAPSLGFEGITPTSTLTPEQVEAFRQRFAPVMAAAPTASNAFPGVQQAAPPEWGAPPAMPPGSGSSGGGGGGGGRIIPLLMVGTVVVAVLGLFGFMIANGGTDEERLDRIAAAEPAEQGPTVTGPNGKPLTKEEREYLAALGAKEEERKEEVCAVMRKISEADQASAQSLTGNETYVEAAMMIPEANAQTQALLDELAPLLPKYAEAIRGMQAIANDMSARIQATGGDPAKIRDVIHQMRTETVPDSVYNGMLALEQYGLDTCGVSINGN